MQRLNRIYLIFLVLVPITFFTKTIVFGQPADYPNKPINLVIPFAAGGGSDVIARIIVALDHDYFGVNMIPVIKPGASGTIATEYVYKSKPDGYTLLFGAPHMTVSFPNMKKVNYDPLELIPVCQINRSNSIGLTHKDSPWDTWDEFVSYAKKNPGKYSYASSGAWGMSHIRLAAIMKAAGVELVHIPYDGGAAEDQALTRGEVDISVGSASHAMPYIKSGELKPLFVVNKERRKDLPNLPTLYEKGINVDIVLWRTIFAPPGTPKEIVDYLESKFSELVKDKSFVKLMDRIGEEIDFVPGDEFHKRLKEEDQVYKDIISTIPKN